MQSPERANAFFLRPATLIVTLLFIVYGALAISYIDRTSFDVDGSRVFCLWDDGMISMRYARNLASGEGFVWNPGEPGVQGYTNLGVTLVMTAIHLLPIGLAYTSLVFQIVNLAALFAIGWLVRRIADRLFGAPAGVFALVMTFASAPVAVWALQGSDSGIVSIWLILCVARVFGCLGRDGNVWWTGLLLAVGPILRLDVMIYIVPLILYIGLSEHESRERNETAKATAVAIGLVTASLGIVLGASLLYYGNPLPNTFYLRASGTPFGLIFQKGITSLHRFTVLWPVLVPALACLAWGVRDRKVRLCAALFAAAVGYNTLVGGDWADPWLSRYATPALPLVFILAAGSGALLLKGLAIRSPGLHNSANAAVFATLAALGLLANPRLAWNEWTGASEPMFRDRNLDHVILSHIFDRQLEDTDVVAVHWAGVTPYFRDGPALDVLGKMDSHIARLRVDRFEPGHSKWDWDYIMDKRPEAILIASRGLRDHPVFRRAYRHAIDRKRVEYSFFIRADIGDRLPVSEYEIRPVESLARAR